MTAILPCLQYFESGVVRILLVISGVETNPGPAYENNNNTNKIKKGKVTRDHTATSMASNIVHGNSILRTMYETGAMIIHKADSNQDLSRMPDIQQHRRLITRLDSKKIGESNTQTNYNQHDMPIFKSSSLDVLSKVISQQKQRTIEEKLQEIMEEMKKMKCESRAQIKRLSHEVERLEKRTQEQQEDIVHLLNESAQFRDQLNSSEVYERDVPDAGSYWNNIAGSHSTDTLDMIDSASFRVSALRAKFEIGGEDIAQSKISDFEMSDRQIINKNHETSVYVSNYINNVSKETKNDSGSTTEETVQFKSSRSVSDLKEYFEKAAVKTQRSKSLSGFADIQQLRLAAAQAKEERTEESTEDVSRIESVENISPYSVSTLKEMFETGSVKNQRTRSSSDVTGIVEKYLTAQTQRRKSTNSPVESPTRNQDFRLSTYSSTYEWNPGTTF